jgi:hypothetical protein
MTPAVSIVIPTHNRRDYLPGAINSVLSQTLSDWELVVVDDGSRDDTASVVAPFLSDRRVRYEVQPQQGRSAARNRGVALAQAQWMAFLDSDDRFLPTCLGDHLAVIAGAGDLAMTLGGYEIVDEAGRRLAERRPWDESGLSLRDWLFNCLGMPGSVMIRRDWLLRLHGFDPACEIAEDWDLFLRLAAEGAAMAWVRRLVCQYRRHAGQSVGRLGQHHQGSLRSLQKLLGQPALPPETAAQAGPALAWVHVLFAHRALLAGQPELAGDFLAQAIVSDPTLAGARKAELLEFMLTPLPGQAEPPQLAAGLWQQRPAALPLTARELRQAQARVAVAAVWRWSSRTAQPGAWPAVPRAYWQGVRYDPRWLGNRGLWSILLRAWAERSRGARGG